jgi:hypothetical protein
MARRYSIRTSRASRSTFTCAGKSTVCPRTSTRHRAKARRREGAKIGSTTADPDGYIALKFSAPIEPGSYQIDLRLAHPGEIELESANRYLLLTVIPADRPIIVTDIDDTLCQSKLLNNNNDAPPFDDAPDTLNEAASQCQVIYLTPRTVHRARETRHWLGAYGFPPGPVFFRDLWSDPEQVGFPESYFKAMFLVRQVRPKWSNIAWGVGHVEGDGEAYSANAIRPILFQPKNLSGEGAEIRVVDGWQEIGVIFKTEGFAAPVEDTANDEDTESTSEATPPGESR